LYIHLFLNEFVLKLAGKILSFFTTLLIVVSTTSIVIGAHFCSGEVHDISLSDKAERCCCSSGDSGEDSDTPNDTPQRDAYEPEICCSDRFFAGKPVNIALPSYNEKTVKNDLPSLTLNIFTDLFVFSTFEYSNLKYTPLNFPPVVISDIPVLVQSFLL